MTTNPDVLFSVWDCVLCLLPSLLLLLLSLVLRWPAVQRCSRLGVRAAGWGLWMALCWALELPLPKVEHGWGWSREKGPAPDSASRPSLACKPTALARYLLQHCGSLVRPRLAHWPKGDPHIQTLSSLLWGAQGRDNCGDGVQFTRDNLLLRDGGIVALDWAVGVRGGEGAGRERWEGKREHHPGARALGCHTSTPPILLLIPHSWGGVTPHLRGLCQLALRQGFYALVFHSRGTAGCPLTTPRLTEFGDPADLVQVVAYVRSRHPSSALVAVSEGSGSGVLLSYLGECGSSSYLTAVACISPVLQGQLWFETPLPSLYRWGALFFRKLQLSRYESALSAVLGVARALRCSSLKDFEEVLFCSGPQPHQNTPHQPPGPPSPGAKLGASSPPLRGLGVLGAWAVGERGCPVSDWEGYWERNEPLRDADEVAVPVLCLCSHDDPLLPPASTLPLSLFQNNPYFLLAMTDRGGHCGFTLEEADREEERGRGGEGERRKGRGVTGAMWLCWSTSGWLLSF